ncbi:MAG: porin family protein, partial [Gammaproteobacteria bacterium]|nr:porin family protein [Gammaproteobacteria bacterium]
LALVPAQAETAGQGYFLVSAGKTDADFRTTSADAVQGDDTSFELGVGFAFNENFAIEASYQDFGEPDGFAGCPPDVLCIAIVPFAREPVSLNGWSAALRGAVPLTGSLSAFGKIGFLSWDTSATNQGLNASGTDLLYAVGVAADLNDRVSLQLSWEQAELDIETVKLGMRFNF